MDDLEKSISYSELSSYMDCPQKHHFAYIERLRKQTFYQSWRIDTGIIVHEGLEKALKAYHNTGYTLLLEDAYRVIDQTVDAYDLANRPPLEEKTIDGFDIDNTDAVLEWEDTVSTAREIAKRTIKHLDVPANWRTEEIKWNGETVPLIEFRFEYPLVEDRNIVGKIDWIARNVKDGQVYLIDWKTRKTFTDDFSVGMEDMNLQLSIYQYVMQSMGVDIFGAITYQIKSVVPAVPKVTNGRTLKDGTVVDRHVSKAKIATDYPTYMKALIDNNEDLDNYAEFLENIQNEDYWFLPVYIYRSMTTLRSRWENVQNIALRMVNDLNPPKYEGHKCKFCPYMSLCLASDAKVDVDSMKEVLYTTDTYRH